MMRIAAKTLVILAALLVSAALLSGCGYRMTWARFSVATLDCTMPAGEAAEPGEASGEQLTPGTEAEAGAGPSAADTVVELVPSPPEAPAEETEETVPEALDPRLADHLESIAQLIKATNADIVALQGVSSEEALDHLLSRLREIGWQKEFRGYKFFDEGTPQASGIVVLTGLRLVSFLSPRLSAEGPPTALEDAQCMEARIELPHGEELILLNFRLHPDRAVQMDEAGALYELTRPLRQPDVSLMLVGCLSDGAPYRDAPTERADTPATILSGVNTRSPRDDLIDLHAYLWPRERATEPEGGQACRIMVSPELTTDAYGRTDWYLTGVEIVGGAETDACGHRAVVARFGLR